MILQTIASSDRKIAAFDDFMTVFPRRPRLRAAGPRQDAVENGTGVFSLTKRRMIQEEPTPPWSRCARSQLRPRPPDRRDRQEQLRSMAPPRTATAAILPSRRLRSPAPCS